MSVKDEDRITNNYLNRTLRLQNNRMEIDQTVNRFITFHASSTEASFFSPFSVSVDLTNTRPTNSGDITLKCPGLYHIEASITKDGSDPGAGFNELALQHYDKNRSFVGTLAFAQRKLMANMESLTVEGHIRVDPSEAGAKIDVVVRGTGTVRGWSTTVTPQVYDVTAEPASFVEITYLGP